MRILRRWKLVLATVLTVVLTLALGVVILLNSPLAARYAAGALGEKLGTRVEIDAVSVGLFGTTVTGVRVFEPDGASGAEPLLAVRAVEADTSLCSLALANLTPRSVVVRSPSVRLTFAADGQLATRLPQPGGGGGAGGPLPAVRVEGGNVTIRQDGKPDAGLSGINLQLTEGHGALTLTGSVVDPEWGEWEIRGSAEASFASGSVEIQGRTPLTLSADRVARLPLVDPSALRDYPFEVRVVAGLRLTVESGKSRPSYRAEVRVEDGTATVAPAGLTVAGLSGVVVVEDSVVTLAGLSASAADGTVRADGRISLGDAIGLDLTVAAQGLDVARVPPCWGVSELVEAGRFSGKAHLLIDLPPGGPVRTGGEGRCVVTGARLLGAAAEGPVELSLRPTGSGFRFGAGAGKAQPESPGEFGDPWLSFLAKQAAPLLARFAAQDDQAGRVKVRFGLRDLDLADLARRLRVEVPFAVAGRVSLHVEADFPADTPNDLAAYRAVGTAEAPTLVLEGVTLQQVKVRVALRQGALHLEELTGILTDAAGPTRFTGSARLGLVPSGDLGARLAVDGLPLALLARFVPGTDLGLAGTVSGALEFAIPAGKLTDVTAWDGKASLSSPSATALGWVLQGFDAGLTVRAGTASLTHLRGSLEGAQVQGSATVGLAGDYPVQARLSLAGFELASADRLRPAFRPPVGLAGKLTTEAVLAGQLRTCQLQISGGAELTAARVEKVPIDRLGFRWVLAPDRLQVTDIAVSVAGGTLTGTAEVPLQGKPGAASLTLRQVSLKDLTHEVSALRPVPVDGLVDGTLTAVIPPNPRDLTASLALTCERLRVRGVTAERVGLAAELHPGGVGYRLVAQALGGSVDLGGYLPLGGTASAGAAQPPDPAPGRLRIEGVRLEQLGEAFGLSRQPPPLSGVASLSLDYSHDPADGRPTGSGRLRLAQVRCGDRELAPTAEADLALSREALRVKEVSAALLQGRFRGHALVNLIDPDRSWAEVSLEQVPLSPFLAAFGATASRLDGRLTLTARSLLGRQLHGEAVALLSRGQVGGLAVTNARMSVAWDVLSASGHGELVVRDLGAQLAGGRVDGKASCLLAADGARLDGKVHFSNVEVGAVARAADTLATVGVGRATGVAELAGRNVHSVKDLTGTVRATLGPAQALRLPVLQDIVPYLGPGRSAATSFNRSEVLAHLSRGGVVRVQRLALAGPHLSVFAEGTVTLPDHLNLDVVASTGDLGMNAGTLEQLGMQVPVAVGPVPVGLILRASKYLSDRTVRLQVTGTAHSPQVRVNPLSLLSEEAIRFFLGGTPINPLQK